MIKAKKSIPQNFKRNPFGYLGLIIIWVIPVLFVVVVIPNSTNGVIEFCNLVGAVCVIALIVSPSLLATFSILQQYSMKFTDFGITVNSLGIRKNICWSEVKEISSSVFGLTLKVHKNLYRINLILYERPNEIIDFVNKQVENSRIEKMPT